MPRPCLPPLLALALAGCGPAVTAPSLEIRPVESQPVPLPGEAREPAVAAAPALVQRLAALEATAVAGDARFREEQRGTERAVAAAVGAAHGSENWTTAQEALSALEALRAPVRDAAAAVEELRQDPGSAGSGARAAIAAAAARLNALGEAEAGTVAGFAKRLG